MILAIDCGSTNQKVALFENDLRRVADCSIPLEYYPGDGVRVEFDPAKFWEGSIMLINRLCAGAGIKSNQIDSISIASQAQTFTLLDSHGDPLTPFISWADKRAQSESERLTRELGGVFHRHSSFPSPLPQLQISKLLWTANNLPEVWKRVSKVVSLPSFLALRIAGLHCSDANIAAMGGLFSMQTGSWWADALRVCSARAEMFGELVSIGGALPARATCPELELMPNLRVVFAGNDQTAGAWGNGLRKGDIVLSLGTALVAYRAAGPMPGPFNATSCWGPLPSGEHYELLTEDHGGAALDWAVTLLAGGRHPDFFRMAAHGSQQGCFFYPELTGSYMAWDRRTNPCDMARAVLEGICFSAKGLIERMSAGEFSGVTVTGGASENDYLLQMLADVLEAPVRRGEGDILLGAAMMANPQVTPRLGPGKNFYPNASSEQYQDLFLAWTAQKEASIKS